MDHTDDDILDRYSDDFAQFIESSMLEDNCVGQPLMLAAGSQV
jgi:hypothetical protein